MMTSSFLNHARWRALPFRLRDLAPYDAPHQRLADTLRDEPKERPLDYAI